MRARTHDDKMATLVDCPFCGARVGKFCKTLGGSQRSKSHLARKKLELTSR